MCLILNILQMFLKYVFLFFNTNIEIQICVDFDLDIESTFVAVFFNSLNHYFLPDLLISENRIPCYCHGFLLDIWLCDIV